MLAMIRTWGVTLSLSLLCLLGGTALAQTQDKLLEINIPAGSLAEALEKLGDQSGLQIMYEPAVAKGVRVAAVNGTLTPSDALGKLIAHTGLKADRVNEKTVVLKVAEKEAEPIKKKQEEPSAAKQPAQEPIEELAEIVVTAQKRQERLLDVPISIVALSSDDLQKRGIARIDDLVFSVPGLSVQNSGLEHRVVLRGLSNFAGSTSSLIGMYLDEADVTSTRGTQLDLSAHDLERVEVLRGPQGTLYGEGSLGGTIRFISKDPVLDHWAMDLGGQASFTQDGAPGQRVDAAVNVPLVTDELGLRVSGLFDHNGGWIDQPAADRKNFNDQNLVDVRTKLLWRPSPQFSVGALATIHRNDAASSHGEDANGNYTQVFNLATTPRGQDDYDLYNLALSYDFGSFRVLSSTSYLRQEKETANYGYVLPFTPAGPGAAILEVVSTSKPEVRSVTDELRLMSTGSGPWQWTAGGYYKHLNFLTNDSYYADFAPAPLPSASFPFVKRNISDSWAVFGDTNYKLTNRLTIGAGLRGFWDHQEQRSGGTQKTNFHATNPRAYIGYKLFDDANAYASAAKGFRSGGFNNPGQPSFGPEDAWTYEAGLKTRLPEQRVSTDIALFYTDYKDYQVLGQLLTPPFLNITTNGGSARIKGIEASIDWIPLDQWRLSLSGNYIDSEFYKIDVTSSDHVVGDPLDFVSKYVFSVGAQRALMWNGRTGSIGLDYSQQGPQNFRLRSIGSFFYSTSDVIRMLNLNATLPLNDNISFGVFAQNLLDNRDRVDPFAIENSAVRQRPRTFGMDIRMKFD